jgi:hypothetical protein
VRPVRQLYQRSFWDGDHSTVFDAVAY